MGPWHINWSYEAILRSALPAPLSLKQQNQESFTLAGWHSCAGSATQAAWSYRCRLRWKWIFVPFWAIFALSLFKFNSSTYKWILYPSSTLTDQKECLIKKFALFWPLTMNYIKVYLIVVTNWILYIWSLCTYVFKEKYLEMVSICSCYYYNTLISGVNKYI